MTHSTVTAIYDRYRYDKEKRAALEKWAEVLAGIVEVKPAPTTGAGERRVRMSTSSGLRHGSVPRQPCAEPQGCVFTHFA